MGTPTRITPALAGKSYVFGPFRPGSWDHPRVGGEKHCPHGINMTFGGSPPRGRGKDTPIGETGAMSGITPAWAGKSRRHEESRTKSKDHPRVGGEKAKSGWTKAKQKGSPPRGRGKVFAFAYVNVYERITPAWAGKRLKRSHRSGIFISGPIPFHSVLHRPAGSGGSRAGRDGSPAGQPQNTGPA